MYVNICLLAPLNYQCCTSPGKWIVNTKSDMTSMKYIADFQMCRASGSKYPLAPDEMSYRSCLLRKRVETVSPKWKVGRGTQSGLLECVTIRSLAFFLLHLGCTGTVPLWTKNIKVIYWVNTLTAESNALPHFYCIVEYCYLLPKRRWKKSFLIDPFFETCN